MSVEIKDALAKYKDLLTFEEKTEYTIIRLKQYVPKPEWDEINTAILNLGGEYIGGIGKDVHWRKPREKPLQSFATFHCPYCNKVINVTFGAPK